MNNATVTPSSSVNDGSPPLLRVILNSSATPSVKWVIPLTSPMIGSKNWTHDNLLAVVNHALRAHGDPTKSALYTAAVNGQSDIVKYLLQLPWIDMDLTDADGNTVLHNVMKNLTGYNRREVTRCTYHRERYVTNCT